MAADPRQSSPAGGSRPQRSGLVLGALRSALIAPIDLAVPPGAIVVVRGPSGSGKTLFLRLVADLDPSEGVVELQGRARDKEHAPAWRRRAAYVAAEPGWWAPIVAEHFASGDLAEARSLATRLQVREDAFDASVARLSTGERQRLAIVRALVLHPPLLLLDEPTGALDPDATSRLEELLRECADQGAIVLMASHDAGQADRLGARELRMEQRRLEAAPWLR